MQIYNIYYINNINNKLKKQIIKEKIIYNINNKAISSYAYI